MKPVLDEYFNNYPETDLHPIGNSVFVTPDLFKQCENNRVSYTIRLKANQNLYKSSQSATKLLDQLTIDNRLDYKVIYDEFYYQAASWDYLRRVVIKISSKAIRSGRYLTFKFCISCPYKKDFFETFEDINKILQLE